MISKKSRHIFEFVAFPGVCSYLKERYNETFWENHKSGNIFEYEERDLPDHFIFSNVIAASIYIFFVLIFMACFHYFHQSVPLTFPTSIHFMMIEFDLFARLPYGWTLLWFSGFILLGNTHLLILFWIMTCERFSLF